MKTMMETYLFVPVSEEHARKVLSYVELAKSEGATVECGGERVIISGTGTALNSFKKKQQQVL
jgi:hypothetical protein